MERIRTPIKDNDMQDDRVISVELSTKSQELFYTETELKKEGLLERNEVLHSKRLYWIGRRTQDIIFSILAILVLWPLVSICAILIVIDSPGASPFFIQERVGRDGKKFKFLNLRCMELVRSLHDKSEHIRDYFCTIQTTNFRSADFRHPNGVFPAVEIG